MLYFVLKFPPLIGAAVLLGTGASIAFFMLLATSGATSASLLAWHGSSSLPTLFLRRRRSWRSLPPVHCAWQAGYSLFEGWMFWSIILYFVTGAFWLPVVWMQIRMRDLAEASVRAQASLPTAYHQLNPASISNRAD